MSSDHHLLVSIAGATVAVPIRCIAEVTRMPALDPPAPGTADARQLLGSFRYRGVTVLCADLAAEFTSSPHVYGAAARLLLLETGAAPLAVPVDGVGRMELLPDEPRQRNAACSDGRFRCVHDLASLDDDIVHYLDVPLLLRAVEAVP